MPAGLRVAIALGLPMIGAITVAGIYLNREVIVAAAWLAFSVGGLVLVEPVVGIVAMTAGFLLVAYPSVLQTLGVLTVNNLLGVCLGVLLLAHVLSTRDLSFVTIRQVLVLAAIGLLLLLSTAHSESIFPVLRASQSLGIKGKMLDRTSDMMHDFWTRLVYLVFFCVFVRSRRGILAVFVTFVLVLFIAVPSALVNWWQGTLSHGFRAVASVTAGANANRLAMIALIQVACWWCWMRGGLHGVRRLFAAAAIGGSLLVVLASGSRSGLLGMAVLALLLQTGPRLYRVPLRHIGVAVFAGVIAIATIVPETAWQRALSYSSERYELGGTSVVKREETIQVGLRMVRDHPFLGIGLGNFREVSRQVYLDEYFRPPHNSYLWAAAEGGLLVFAGYALLFAFTWRDLKTVTRLAHRDPRTAHVAAAMRVTFLLYCFFAFFADLWLNPLTYVMVGLVVTMRQYLERLPAPVVPTAGLAPRAASGPAR
ncbi:MAG TPA: O-antigen ligase family protein [Candidatus Binatia bacterium]|nr:O-antigen ligase family protein [Candidatus Binatia bacterium]